MKPIQGLHHITAVAGDPQTNVDFYRLVLGQRLVKRTVNFDDPSTYHFYYGDEIGTPGTLMTHFPWRHMRPGRRGNGETAAVAYAIPAASLGYWHDRLRRLGIEVDEGEVRFDEGILQFSDPDGMPLELVATQDAATLQHWESGPVPEAHALRGFHHVTLWLNEAGPTADLLTGQLGYRPAGQEGTRSRFEGGSGDTARYIDILERPGEPTGRFGAGSVHHIAFRTVDDGEQREYLQLLTEAGHRVTPVQDRQYFRSIYFRSPGGVLFEIATDAPGFLYDEPLEELGTNLKLPAWFEAQRDLIEQALPDFELKPLETEHA